MGSFGMKTFLSDFSYSFSLRHISTFKTVPPPLGSIESIDHSLNFDITNL